LPIKCISQYDFRLRVFFKSSQYHFIGVLFLIQNIVETDTLAKPLLTKLVHKWFKFLFSSHL